MTLFVRVLFEGRSVTAVVPGKACCVSDGGGETALRLPRDLEEGPAGLTSSSAVLEALSSVDELELEKARLEVNLRALYIS